MPVYRDALVRLGSQKWFSDFTAAVLVPVDRTLYRVSGGRVSMLHLGRSEALPSLLLTTTGRRSGQPRTTPVLYITDEESGALFVIASNFGREHHPAWSANLLADPHAWIQLHDEHRAVIARPASEQDVERLWPRLLEIYPSWTSYRERTDRTFRGFFLDAA